MFASLLSRLSPPFALAEARCRAHDSHEGRATVGISAKASEVLAYADPPPCENTAEKLTGQAKEKAGDVTDDQDLQAEGKKDQTKGSLKNAGENIKDAFK